MKVAKLFSAATKEEESKLQPSGERVSSRQPTSAVLHASGLYGGDFVRRPICGGLMGDQLAAGCITQGGAPSNWVREVI